MADANDDLLGFRTKLSSALVRVRHDSSFGLLVLAAVHWHSDLHNHMLPPPPPRLPHFCSLFPCRSRSPLMGNRRTFAPKKPDWGYASKAAVLRRWLPYMVRAAACHAVCTTGESCFRMEAVTCSLALPQLVARKMSMSATTIILGDSPPFPGEYCTTRTRPSECRGNAEIGSISCKSPRHHRLSDRE